MSDEKTPKYGTSLDNEENAGTAAREREMARQNRANAEFIERSNAAIEAFGDADDDDRESVITEININVPAQVAAAKASLAAPRDRRSESPGSRGTLLPPIVSVVVNKFPRPWRPVAGLLILGFALYYGPQVPFVRAMLGMDPLPKMAPPAPVAPEPSAE